MDQVVIRAVSPGQRFLKSTVIPSRSSPALVCRICVVSPPVFRSRLSRTSHKTRTGFTLYTDTTSGYRRHLEIRTESFHVPISASIIFTF